MPFNLHSRSGIRFLQTDAAAMLGITLACILIELLIGPFGEFPLNDDWSYTRSLQHLYFQNRFKLEGWTSMPLVGQLLWGWLFCKIFGFSFSVLRISTVVLGWAGGLAVYKLTREFTSHKGIAFLAALTLLFNPIWCNLSNTFMTDIPFTTLQLAAMFFFVRYLKTARTVYILPGMVLIILAILIRQLGLLAAAAWSITVILQYGTRPKAVFYAAIMFILPLAIYLGFNHWLRVTNNYPSKYDEGFKRVIQTLFSQDHSPIRLLLRQLLRLLVYAGFFILPVCCCFDWRHIKRKWQLFAKTAVACMILTAGYCFLYKPVMPEMGNIMNVFGLGPVSMRDVSILQNHSLIPLSAVWWQIFTVAGILGAGAILVAGSVCLRRMLLRTPAPQTEGLRPLILNGLPMPIARLRQIFASKRQILLPPQLVFLVIFIGLYFLLLLIGGTYDRYLLPIVPAFTILLISCFGSVLARKRYNYVLACILLIGYGTFSITGTRDYLSWNRARWLAIDYLTREKQVPVRQIDGGFEFNAWFQYNDVDMTTAKEKADPNQKSWWWVDNDEYLLAFAPIAHYETIRTFSFHRHLGPSAPTGDKIYVLHKVQ